MKTVIAAATRAHESEQCDALPIVRSIHERLQGKPIFELYTDNTLGLSELYNDVLNKYRKHSDVKWLVFAHDDVYIDDAHLRNKLDQSHQQHGFDIIGLAGCINPTIKTHNLWHIMASREHLRGHVAHPAAPNGVIQMSSFGPTPSRVAIIDGLFMALHMPSVRESQWKFNENYKFHHYDIASCIDANRHRLKIGVAPINVIHSSPGLLSVNDASWKTSNEMFLKEYGSSV